ncbi:hypothetical protein A8A03_01935 [Escherichia coli]|nr:hypothetical protein A8A03_01935 [Escherichia coli]
MGNIKITHQDVNLFSVLVGADLLRLPEEGPLALLDGCDSVVLLSITGTAKASPVTILMETPRAERQRWWWQCQSAGDRTWEGDQAAACSAEGAQNLRMALGAPLAAVGHRPSELRQ